MCCCSASSETVIVLVSLATGLKLKRSQDSEADRDNQADTDEPQLLAGNRTADGQQQEGNRNGGVPPCHPAETGKPHVSLAHRGDKINQHIPFCSACPAP